MYSKRPRWRPTHPYAGIQRGIIDSRFSRPLGNGLRLSSKGDSDIGARVIGLFVGRCPSAVFRFIRTIYINSVQGMLRRWSWSHVGKKGRETLFPAVANGNPTTSIIGEMPSGWTIAASLHATPSLILRRAASPVLPVTLNRKLLFQASTTSYLTKFQCGARCFPLLAAVALAKPSLIVNVMQDNQATKPLSTNVNYGASQLHSQRNSTELWLVQADALLGELA